VGATVFKAIDFVPHEPITRDKLDAMQANSQWIMENTPRGRFIPDSGPSVESELIIVGGRTVIPRYKYNRWAYATVHFGSSFEPGTYVHVTTGVVSQQKKRVHCITNGPVGTDFPDYRGFDIEIYVLDLSERPALVRGKAQADKPDQLIYVFWSAMGKRRKNT
jgi:hypothetical protein